MTNETTEKFDIWQLNFVWQAKLVRNLKIDNLKLLDMTNFEEIHYFETVIQE